MHGPSPSRFSAGQFRERAEPHLGHDVDAVYAGEPSGDELMFPTPGFHPPDLPPAGPIATLDSAPGVRPKLKDAAVLVPVVAREPDATVLLTVRTAHLSSHAGQIAFPGGKIDETDPTPAAAALREAEEEIGLSAGHVDILGYAAPYHTRSGFRILPVLALVDPRFTLAPNPNEVADVFEVPLGFLMNPDNHRIGFREAPTGRRYFYEMPWGERYIWGVTAGIVRRIYERVYA